MRGGGDQQVGAVCQACLVECSHCSWVLSDAHVPRYKWMGGGSPGCSLTTVPFIRLLASKRRQGGVGAHCSEPQVTLSSGHCVTGAQKPKRRRMPLAPRPPPSGTWTSPPAWRPPAGVSSRRCAAVDLAPTPAYMSQEPSAQAGVSRAG